MTKTATCKKSIVPGAKLRAIREFAGIDQGSVSVASGIDRGELSRIETGKRVVTRADAERILRAIETLRARNGAKFERTMAKVRELLREEAAA